MKIDGHCILHGNGIYCFEGMFDNSYRNFEFIFKGFHKRYVCDCFGTYSNNNKMIYFPIIVYEVVN